MYEYDYRHKTAASLEVYDKWDGIISKYRRLQEADLNRLLKEAGVHLQRQGLELDERKSDLGVEYGSSGQPKMVGMLYIRELDEVLVERFAEAGGFEGCRGNSSSQVQNRHGFVWICTTGRREL